MSDILLKDLAKDLNKSEETLVKQFADAGINKVASDKVSIKEKEALTKFLQTQHGVNTKKKMTLQRKEKSTLNVKGQSNAVNVEVRKKRTYVKREDTEAAQAEKDAAALAVKEAEDAKLHAEMEAKKAAAEKIQAEKLAAKKLADEKAKKAAAANKEKHAAPKVEKTAEQLAAEKETAALLKKAEKEALEKAEKEALKLAEDAKKLAEENSGRWAEEEAARKKAAEGGDDGETEAAPKPKKKKKGD